MAGLLVANIDALSKGGSRVYVITASDGTFAEFPQVEQLQAYLAARSLPALWKGPEEEMPADPNITLWKAA